MPFLIKSIEDRIRYRFGDLLLENESFKQQIDSLEERVSVLQKEIEDSKLGQK